LPDTPAPISAYVGDGTYLYCNLQAVACHIPVSRRSRFKISGMMVVSWYVWRMAGCRRWGRSQLPNSIKGRQCGAGTIFFSRVTFPLTWRMLSKSLSVPSPWCVNCCRSSLLLAREMLNCVPARLCPSQGTVPMSAGGNKNALNRLIAQDGKRGWSYGLFDCFSACGLCALNRSTRTSS